MRGIKRKVMVALACAIVSVLRCLRRLLALQRQQAEGGSSHRMCQQVPVRLLPIY